MASTYSIRFRLNYQAPGDNLNLWGGVLNVGVFQLLEDAMAKRVAFSLSGAKTLTTANGAADEARCAFLDVTGGTGGTITIPSVEKTYLVRNNSSGDVIVTTGGVTTATLTAGEINFVVCDAAAVRPLGLNGPTKAYVDGVAWSYNAGNLPAQAGNAGKFIKTDGTTASWQYPTPTDIAGFAASVPIIRTGTAVNSAMTPGGEYLALAEVALTSASGSIAVDMATFINASHSMTENTTLANPTNSKVGQTGYILIRQHASAAKTLSFAANWKRVGGAPTLTTTLSAYAVLAYEVTSAFVWFDLVSPT